MASPFTITVYDKDFQRVGFIGAPREVEIHPRHNQQPTATVTVENNSPYAADFLRAGARLTIDYDGEQILSGPIRQRHGEVVPDAAVTLTVEDDWRLLTRILAWPAPTHTINAQGSEKAFDTKTGPAETVVKWFLSRNVTRLGLPVTIATDLGRGDTITVSARMMPPADRLLPLLDQAGIGVSVRQVGAGLVVDCYEVAQFPITLTQSSGIVQACEWDTAGATASRVIVGGGGFKKDRDFREYVNTALEASNNDLIEIFIDAEDAYSEAGQARDKWLDAVKDEKEKAKDLATATKLLHKADIANDIAQNAYDDGHTAPKLTTLNSAVDDYNDAADDYSDALNDHNDAVALVASTLATYNTELAAYHDELDRRGAEALAAGGPLVGLKLTLAETDSFRYGRTVRVGDLVTTAVVPGSTPITDVLREAVLMWSTDNGFTVTPVIGDRSDDPTRTFVRAVASIGRAVRNLKARS